MRKLCLYLYASTLLTTCAYQPEDAGLCRLSCSKAVIGSNDLSMAIKLQSSSSTIVCPVAKANADSTPVVAQFLVAEQFYSDSGKTKVEQTRPVPNISFEPIVNGPRSTSARNVINAGANPDVPGEYDNVRYIGIPTPRDNWCSDSCGIATIEVTPLCPPAGQTSQVSIQVHSGALYSDTVTFDIKTEEAAAAAAVK